MNSSAIVVPRMHASPYDRSQDLVALLAIEGRAELLH